MTDTPAPTTPGPMPAEARGLFILAGTHQQAMYAARHLPPEQRWRYVEGPRDLYGVRDEPYIIVGTFWERRDAHELFALTRVNRMDQAADSGIFRVGRSLENDR